MPRAEGLSICKRWWSHLADRVDAVATLGWPLRCPVCGATTDLIQRPWCPACARQVRLWGQAVCPSCRCFRLPADADCPAAHEPASPRIVVALGAYDRAFGAVVQTLKYERLRALATPLGRMLGTRLRETVTIHTVVAVPTAPHKRRERGFGHAEIIASAIAGHLGAHFRDGAIGFTRRVADQTRLSPARRRANVNGAFVVPVDAEIGGKNVLVVDDVMTTGATIGEASRALLAAGAAGVIGAVVAVNLGTNPRDRQNY